MCGPDIKRVRHDGERSGPNSERSGPGCQPLARAGELRPESWTRLMVVVMRLAVGPDPGILLGSGP